MGYERDNWGTRVQFPVSPLHIVYTGSGFASCCICWVLGVFSWAINLHSMKMMKLTSDLDLMPDLRMYGVTPPLPLFLHIMVHNSEQGLLYLLPSLYVISMGCSTVKYWCIKHFNIQLTHNIRYVDTIKIIKYLKLLQHVSDHRGSIIRKPCTVLAQKLQEWFYCVCWRGQGRCHGSILWPCVCSSLYIKALHIQWTTVQGSLMMDPLSSKTCWSTFKYFIILIVSTYYILCVSWIIKCLIIIDARCKHEDYWCIFHYCSLLCKSEL